MEYLYLSKKQLEVLEKYNRKDLAHGWNRKYSGQRLDNNERNIMSQIRKKYLKAQKIIEEIQSFSRITQYWNYKIKD